jgi:hypothetical protein
MLAVFCVTLFILLCRRLSIHFPCSICFCKKELSNLIMSCSYHSISYYSSLKFYRPRISVMIVSLLIMISSFILSYITIDGLALNSFFGHNFIFLPKNRYESTQEVMKILPSDSPYDVDSLEVITGASAPYYPRTLNLIGSIHHFEANMKIHVYDIGFTSSQRQALVCMKNVILHTFNFEIYPAHVRDLKNFAWKILAMEEHMRLYGISGNKSDDVNGVFRRNSFVWLDSGLEAASPFAAHLIDVLRKQGHISATQARYSSSSEQTKILSELYGPDAANSAIGSRYCAGGFQGIVVGSKAHLKILNEAARCAMRAECINVVASQVGVLPKV